MLDIIGLFTFWREKGPKGTWGSMSLTENTAFIMYGLYKLIIINNDNNIYELFPEKIFCQVCKNEIFKDTFYQFINFDRKKLTD